MFAGIQQNQLVFFIFSQLPEYPLSSSVNEPARGVLRIYDHILWRIWHSRRFGGGSLDVVLRLVQVENNGGIDREPLTGLVDHDINYHKELFEAGDVE